MKQALSLVISQGLQDRKAFRDKMCNLYNVALPSTCGTSQPLSIYFPARSLTLPG